MLVLSFSPWQRGEAVIAVLLFISRYNVLYVKMSLIVAVDPFITNG